ncbi:MAG: TIGR03564 family F420-dependent LLM class oxidoreductase [Microthrixaceae bacterium]
MRIGINGSSQTTLGVAIDGIAEHAAGVEADGFAHYWINQSFGSPDALTALAIIGRATESIELGTAVVPTFPRHPLQLATQALTVQEIIGNRLTLGLGLAHKPSIEATLDIAFERPAAHMREYLDVLIPMMNDRTADSHGDIWSAHFEGFAGLVDAEAPGLLLAAMGPQMLRMAAERADGSILWLAGPKTISEHIKPSLDGARPATAAPARIVASMPLCVTERGDEVRAMVDAMLEGYNDLPSYRAVMDRDGSGGPGGASVIGTEAEVLAAIEQFAEAGCTDFAPVEFTLSDDEAEATRTVLKSLL